MYQKCPKCNGEGFIETITLKNSIILNKEMCPICKGECIIHTETGLPPKLHNTQTKEVYAASLNKSVENKKETLGFKCPYMNKECLFIDTTGTVKTRDCYNCPYSSEIFDKRIF